MQKSNKEQARWHQYGVATAIAGGFYQGELTVAELLTWGDFGNGAPAYLDGELTVINGKAWHSRAQKGTVEADPSLKLSYGGVVRFLPLVGFKLKGTFSKAELEENLTQYLSLSNRMYGVKIEGDFDYIQTRAFPPVPEDCQTPVAELIDRQENCEYRNIHGTIISTKFPAWMNGVNVVGYHSHFLSDDETVGGHILNFTGRNFSVVVCHIKGMEVEVPQGPDFDKIDLAKFTYKDVDKIESFQKKVSE